MIPQIAVSVAPKVAKATAGMNSSDFGAALKSIEGGGNSKSISSTSSFMVKSQNSVVSSSKVNANPEVSQSQTRVLLERMTRAQKQMDEVLQLAESGKTFTPAQLLSLQAQVYRSSQELDLAGKLVEKVTGGVKQVLQTQL